MIHVGIDLGTTHTVLAFARDEDVELFDVEQLVSPRQSDRLPLLPSCLYAPLADEVDPSFVDGQWIVGELARQRAAEVAGRSIVSAKSWLSYGEVDRSAAILPWRLDDDDDDIERISPIAAQRAILARVSSAWNAIHAREPLAAQSVVLTVPASFDAVARELTVRAAREAGLTPRLLEEPLAAFYDWAESDAILATALPATSDEGRVLIVDVGGGTTDLSLVRVRREGDGFSLARLAVGRHLLLGGDNMDLALAHHCEAIMTKEKLPPRRFAELVVACRRAKELLLADDAPDQTLVTVLGSGSRMLGGGLSAALERDHVRELCESGFFPRVSLDDGASRVRSAMRAFGLPYERDVAITRHVAGFCGRHGTPTALLLNGGVFRARALATRLHEVVQSWSDQPITLLAAARPDFAVARGAARYALALAGRGRRIASGATRGYYLGVEGPASEGGGKGAAVCVLPHAAEEEQVHRASRSFELALGEQVRFDLWAAESSDAAGQMVAIDDRFEPMPPLIAELPGERAAKVVLEAQLTAIGTLEICGVGEDGARYPLSFDLKGAASGAGSRRGPRHAKRIEQSHEALARVYGKGATASEREAKGLVRELERICGKREGWDVELCRALFDRLWSFHRGRRQSADHERVFWQLAGFSLRPGSGAGRDRERAAMLFGLFDQRLAHSEQRSWQHFWIAWRRIAAGLDDAAQTRIRDAIDPYLAPSELKLKREKAFRNDAVAEMIELAAGLERTAPASKASLGDWLLERTWVDRDPRLWSALGRVGARVPAYASVHQVVSARTVERWIEQLLRVKWQDIATAPRAALSLCRLTGDRERDLADRVRAQVDKRLAMVGAGEEDRRPLHEVVAVGEREQSEFFGEDLPAGLRLA
jgi:molecular chaperone DnaK (HSP70)